MSSSSRAVVVTVEDLSTGHAFTRRFDQREIRIGRAHDADVRLDHPFVQPHHGTLLVDDGRIAYRDSDATNGTLLDGAPIGAGVVLLASRSELRVGAVLRIGATRPIEPPTVLLEAGAAGRCTPASGLQAPAPAVPLMMDAPPRRGDALPPRHEPRSFLSPGMPPTERLPPSGPWRHADSAQPGVQAGSLRAGTILGERYEVLGLLGAGGMGAVYRCRDRRTFGKVVAVKTLAPDMVSNPAAHARLKREAEMVSRLSHENLVEVIDFQDEHDVPFIVMELLDGEDLGARLARLGRLPIEDAIDIMLDVCSGVGAAHDQGIIHRDLKPQNVFICSGRRGEVRKVLDFGVCKPMSSADLTSSSAIVGTAAYMAPEQAAGRQVDARCDQYALGVLLYQMITGQLPYAVSSHFEMLEAIIRGRAEPAHRHRPDLPDELAGAIARAMSVEASDRFPSVHELGAALLKFASPLGMALWTRYYTQAASEGGAPARAKVVRRAIDAEAAPPHPPAAMGTPGRTKLLPSASPPSAAASRADRPRSRWGVALAGLGLLAGAAFASYRLIGTRGAPAAPRAGSAPARPPASPPPVEALEVVRERRAEGRSELAPDLAAADEAAAPVRSRHLDAPRDRHAVPRGGRARARAVDERADRAQAARRPRRGRAPARAQDTTPDGMPILR